jgi:peptidoglycan/LPS O-acetylase OafA/YrhL
VKSRGRAPYPIGSERPAVGPAATPQALRHLPHVDGLRGLAVLLVVAGHAWPAAVPGGFIGVDMFFVISGFIITRQILAERAQKRFVYTQFLARRVRRLVPAAFVCLAVVSLCAAVLLLPDALVAYARNLVATALFYANIYDLQHVSYFAAPAETKPLLHMWSLSIEDQFYLSWPLVLGLVEFLAPSRRLLLPLIAAATAASLAYAAIIVRNAPDYAFYALLPRCFPLLFGCGLAVASAGGVSRARLAALPRTLLELLAFAAVGASALWLDGGSAYPGLATLPVCLGTLLWIVLGREDRSVTGRMFGLPILVLIGQMSYSLYLWHWPLLALARYRLGRSLSAGEAALLVALAVLAAALSWRFVERPFRRAAVVPFRQLGLAAASIALTCGFAAAVVAGKGWSWRLDGPRRDLYAQMASSNPFRAACDGAQQAFANDARCTFGRRASAAAPFDIAIFGDSNADHFVPMIADLAARRGLAGRQVTQSTCAPLIGASRERPEREEAACIDYQDTILAFLARNPHLKLAVLSAVWAGYYGPLHPNRLAGEAHPEREDFEAFVAATVHLLRGRGIKVLIIGQIPHFKSFPLPCFLNAVETGSPDGRCGVSRATIEAELDRSLTLFHRLETEDPGVSLFDPAAVLCGPEVCSPFKDGLFAYHDFGHLNAVGAAALARYGMLPNDL